MHTSIFRLQAYVNPFLVRGCALGFIFNFRWLSPGFRIEFNRVSYRIGKNQPSFILGFGDEREIGADGLRGWHSACDGGFWVEVDVSGELERDIIRDDTPNFVYDFRCIYTGSNMGVYTGFRIDLADIHRISYGFLDDWLGGF